MESVTGDHRATVLTSLSPNWMSAWQGECGPQRAQQSATIRELPAGQRPPGGRKARRQSQEEEPDTWRTRAQGAPERAWAQRGAISSCQADGRAMPSRWPLIAPHAGDSPNPRGQPSRTPHGPGRGGLSRQPELLSLHRSLGPVGRDSLMFRFACSWPGGTRPQGPRDLHVSRASLWETVLQEGPRGGGLWAGGRGPWGDPEGGEMVPLACPFLVGPSWWVWRVGSGRL